MLKIIPVALFFLSFFASLVANAIFRHLSKENNFLIDSPDKHRKFHKNPTPLTGGLGISFGIIFSGFFLFFLSENQYGYDLSKDNFLGNDSVKTSQNNSYEMKTSDNKELIINKINETSFSITLPNGGTRTYEIGNQGEPILVSTENIKNKIYLTNFGIGLIFFTLLVQLSMIFDDLWSLRPALRLSIQALCVSGLIYVSGIYIESLGNLLGTGEINLGLFGIPFTIFCIVGMMNAFNMIDGLNGLCASLCLVCFSTIMIMINAGSVPSLFPLILPVGAVVGFLMYNLGILGDNRTVFLGDNGSNALGFMCAWILVYFSSENNSNFAPVTALWLVAIPFIDAVGVMTSRVLRGVMPHRPGRDHIHHKLLKYGFSPYSIYLILIALSLVFAIIGLIMNNIFLVNHYFSFYAFILACACYYLSTRFIFKNV